MTARQHHRRGQEATITLTKAVTHIRLSETNACKLAALDVLAPVYLALCQQYVTYFCTTVMLLTNSFFGPLSEGD
jgi:hypothetical protein